MMFYIAALPARLFCGGSLAFRFDQTRHLVDAYQFLYLPIKQVSLENSQPAHIKNGLLFVRPDEPPHQLVIFPTLFGREHLV